MKIHRCAVTHLAKAADSSRERQAVLDEWMSLARLAIDEGAELIACPELFLHIDLPQGHWRSETETPGGPLWEKLANFSRTHQCLVLSSLLIDSTAGLQNAAVLFDHGTPQVFPKLRPTREEKMEGVVAGQAAPVVETSVGRVAALTCFDLNFPELHIALAEQRPDLVLFPTMFRGGLRLNALALQVSAYVLSCSVSESCLVNPVGRVLHRWGLREESSASFAPLSLTDVNLDYGVYHYDNNAARAGQIGKQFPGEFRIEHAQAEGLFIIESLATRSVKDLERELSLVRALDYFDASR